tara:strand:+ start:75166 stop:75345 length:180 start_codon:yes stop_codon:yes gene_type:complete
MTLQMAVQALSTKLGSALEDIAKFEDKGNDAAARRARKSLQEIAVACKELRAAIQEKRK